MTDAFRFCCQNLVPSGNTFALKVGKGNSTHFSRMRKVKITKTQCR